MKRSEFLARVAGGAFAVTAADAMPADGPFATTEVEESYAGYLNTAQPFTSRKSAWRDILSEMSECL